MPSNNNQHRAPVGSASRPHSSSPQPTSPDTEPQPKITAAPDAAVCGATGCTTTDHLAKVSNVKPHPRILCPNCRENFLARHTDAETDTDDTDAPTRSPDQ